MAKTVSRGQEGAGMNPSLGTSTSKVDTHIPTGSEHVDSSTDPIFELLEQTQVGGNKLRSLASKSRQTTVWAQEKNGN